MKKTKAWAIFYKRGNYLPTGIIKGNKMKWIFITRKDALEELNNFGWEPKKDYKVIPCEIVFKS